MAMELESCNCPMYVDFEGLNIYEDDGADDWFDIINQESGNEVVNNKENNKSRGRSLIPMNRLYNGSNKMRTRMSMPKISPRSGILRQKNVEDALPKRTEIKSNNKSVIFKKMTAERKPASVKTELQTVLKDKLGECCRVPTKSVPIENQPDKQPKDFTASLRNFSGSNNNKPTENIRLKITKVQPFKLTESKRKIGPESEFRSVAQQVTAFHKKTPKRFHTYRRRSSLAKHTVPVKPRKPTVPKTPNLQTKSRSRPTSAPSQEQKEEKILEEIQKHQFKAQPLDPRILTDTIGIKKVESKPPTKQQPFHLSTSLKSKRRSASLDSLKAEPSFHARPVPAGLFEKPKGLGQFKEIPLTLPKTPSFTQRPQRRRSLSLDNKREVVKFRTPQAQQAPTMTGIPNKVKPNKCTTVEPFSFDSHDRERMMKKEGKIKEFLEYEKKLREFRAHPMPDLSSVKVPDKQVRPPTEFQPFNFLKQALNTSRVEMLKKEIEEELEKQRQLANFKARPMKVTAPFIPAKSNKPLTVVNDFDLNTELRAMSRSEFDEQVKENLEYKKALIRQREREREEAEQALIAQIRKEAVHKANPVRKYKPVEVKPSDLPLTLPITPPFLNKGKK